MNSTIHFYFFGKSHETTRTRNKLKNSLHIEKKKNIILGHSGTDHGNAPKIKMKKFTHKSFFFLKRFVRDQKWGGKGRRVHARKKHKPALFCFVLSK